MRTLGGRPSPTLSHWLAERTGGNPFFAGELLGELAACGGLRMTADGFAPPAGEALPGGVNALMIARLDRQPAPLKRAAQAAAVLGREFAAALAQERGAAE